MHIFNEAEIPPTFILDKSTPGTTAGVVFAFLKWLTWAKVMVEMIQTVPLTAILQHQPLVYTVLLLLDDIVGCFGYVSVVQPRCRLNE